MTGADPRSTATEEQAVHRRLMRFGELRAEWVRVLGPGRVRDLEASLRTVVPSGFPLDVPGWLGS